MGTHPIFESDFDCLTDINMVEEVIVTVEEEKTIKVDEIEKVETEKVEEVPVDVADDDDDEEEEEEEDELVDPLDALRVSCSTDAESKALLSVLADCTQRVEGRSMTEESCQQEQFDFLGHRDHCVAHHLFSHLK